MNAPIGNVIAARWCISRLQSSGQCVYHQFSIQQLYTLPTLYLCVLCGSENKQRLVPLTA